MLGWVCTIPPSRFHFKFEIEAPIEVPGNFVKSVPTLTFEGINTHAHKRPVIPTSGHYEGVALSG